MGINDYGAPLDPLNYPSLSAWAAAVVAVLDGDDTTVDERVSFATSNKVSKTGDTMTGALTIEDTGNLSSRAVIGVESLKALNGIIYTRPTPQASVGAARMVVADPQAADEAATKAYVDNADAGKAAASHTHSYVAKSGDEMTGKLLVSTPQGIAFHYPGSAVASIGGFNYGGIYGLRFTQGWQGDSGALAPLQIGAPVDGNSAATVSWVQGDRAAASHGYHPVRHGTTIVVTTDAAGGFGYTHWGGGSGTPLVSNGDFGAHARAPHIHSWDANTFWVTNLNANQAFRANWITLT
jgi:hypothetical protein